MQVILLEKISNLGLLGEVVRVKDGYARNFLLPLGYAVPITKANMAEIEKARAQALAEELLAGGWRGAARRNSLHRIGKKWQNQKQPIRKSEIVKVV